RRQRRAPRSARVRDRTAVAAESDTPPRASCLHHLGRARRELEPWLAHGREGTEPSAFTQPFAQWCRIVERAADQPLARRRDCELRPELRRDRQSQLLAAAPARS